MKNVSKISLWYLPLIFSNGVTRHVVEYDKLWFQPEIICNAVCEQCLQISIYVYPLFSQILSHDMLLLSMINCVKNVYLLIFTRFQPELHFCQVFNCNAVCEQCLQISIYISPLFSQISTQTSNVVSTMNSDFSQNSLVMLCEECLQISIYFYP